MFFMQNLITFHLVAKRDLDVAFLHEIKHDRTYLRFYSNISQELKIAI